MQQHGGLRGTLFYDKIPVMCCPCAGEKQVHSKKEERRN